jgi:RNA polymerase sigma factor (sigma-70 family)
MKPYRNHTNYELLKKGHVSGLVNIHAKYHKSIYWIGMSLIRDSFVVETLVQDTFLKLWVNRGTIEEPKHIFNFLRFVMTRECNTFYSRPKNQFLRNLSSLESFGNYQDYMAGYDSLSESENLQEHEQEQKTFDRIKRVLPLLNPERKHLIELCLKYGFHYKAISKVMGIGITETTNEVKKAISDIKTIIHQESRLKVKNQPDTQIKPQYKLTEQQQRVLKLRYEKEYSFSTIASELNLSQKEVHNQFMAAYKFLQDKHLQQQQSA